MDNRDIKEATLDYFQNVIHWQQFAAKGTSAKASCYMECRRTIMVGLKNQLSLPHQTTIPVYSLCSWEELVHTASTQSLSCQILPLRLLLPKGSKKAGQLVQSPFLSANVLQLPLRPKQVIKSINESFLFMRLSASSELLRGYLLSASCYFPEQT